MENVLGKIKEIRKQKGFSHEYMAHKLDMSQPAYSKIEKNETVLSVDRLFKIAEILETPVNDILEINPNNIYHQTNNDNAIVPLRSFVTTFKRLNKKFPSLKNDFAL